MRRLEAESLIVIFNAARRATRSASLLADICPRILPGAHGLINGGQTSLHDGLLTGFSIPPRSGEVLAVAT